MIVRENELTSSRARFVKVQLSGLYVKDDTNGKCLEKDSAIRTLILFIMSLYYAYCLSQPFFS